MLYQRNTYKPKPPKTHLIIRLTFPGRLLKVFDYSANTNGCQIINQHSTNAKVLVAESIIYNFQKPSKRRGVQRLTLQELAKARKPQI